MGATGEEKFEDVPLGNDTNALPEKAPYEGGPVQRSSTTTTTGKRGVYRYLILILILLVIVGLAVGLVVGLTGNDDTQEDSPVAPLISPAPTDSPVAPLISPAPTDLEEKCSQENLGAGGAMAAECEQACRQASCCVAIGDAQCLDDNCAGYEICSQLYIQQADSSFPYTKAFVDAACTMEEPGLCTDICEPVGCCNLSDGSCFQDEAESCVNYAKCHAAIEPEGVKAASKSLAELCSPESIEDDPTPCEDACEPVECCYSDELECPASMFLACLDYVVCQNLRPNRAISVAPPDLGLICNPIWGDRDECESICESASCCLGNLDPDEESCLQSDLEACLSYTPCGQLLIAPPNSVVDPAPSDLSEVCSLSYLSTNGCSDCDEACEPASCCDDLNLGNCFLQDPIGCLEYGMCGLRHLACGTVPWPQPNIATTCSISNLEQGGEKVQECLDACDPGACCLADGEETCLSHNALICAAYAPCLQLFVAGGDLEEPPSDLAQLCSSSADIAECAAACNEEASCCYSVQEDNCLVGNIRTCANWLNDGCWRIPGWVF